MTLNDLDFQHRVTPSLAYDRALTNAASAVTSADVKVSEWKSAGQYLTKNREKNHLVRGLWLLYNCRITLK